MLQLAHVQAPAVCTCCTLSYAGDKKVSSDPFSEETEEQVAQKKEVMESLHASFIDFVKGRRAASLLDPEKNDLFSGKVWTGRDAAAVGLVDRVGTMQEVRSLSKNHH